jgi:hypothetical protein
METAQRETVAAIHAYARVLEIHMKAVEQGANPMAGSDIVMNAATALDREVKLLRFLREEEYKDHLGSRAGR